MTLHTVATKSRHSLPVVDMNKLKNRVTCETRELKKKTKKRKKLQENEILNYMFSRWKRTRKNKKKKRLNDIWIRKETRNNIFCEPEKSKINVFHIKKNSMFFYCEKDEEKGRETLSSIKCNKRQFDNWESTIRMILSPTRILMIPLSTF